MADATGYTPAAQWERLSLLFETAQSIPPTERATFFETECGTDAPLRRQLEALLTAAPDAPDFLDALSRNVLAKTLGPALLADLTSHDAGLVPPLAPAAQLPAFVRHYAVRDLIGGGGMGVVYRGRDTLLDRDVALKFVSPERLAAQDAKRRLIREAQAVSLLDSPHVCTIHAVEALTDGGVCLVMAYCAGGTLREQLQTGPLPLERALDIATQLARGLAVAHRAGLVHRDLKPANIGFADGAVVRILDFGVASRSDAGGGIGAPAMYGTLPYMAPELLRGDVAGPTADVWALGVILVEMLTGRRPFQGASEAQLIAAILASPPQPALFSFDDAIPLSVKQLLADLLAPTPELRLADGGRVLDRLLSLRLDSPVAELAPARVIVPTEIARTRRRWPVVMLGTLAAASGVVALFALRRERSPDPIQSVEIVRSAVPRPTVAVLPFSVRGGPEIAYLEAGMVDLLTPAFDATGLLHGIDPNVVLSVRAAQGARTLDSALALAAAKQMGAARYVVGSVVKTGATLSIRATLYRSDGSESGRAQVAAATPDSLPSAISAVVQRLVASELNAPGDTLGAVAAATTTSSRALRAYLDGERELRDARPAAAVDFFRRAVEEDSTFALAWYKLARAAKWSEVDSLNAAATARAYALVGTLPNRTQVIVAAYYNLRLGSPATAERALNRIVTDYPTDVDAWMLLGESRFDHGPFRGRPREEVDTAFRQVMTLDPRNREVTVYAMELAARANRVGALDTLFNMYFSPNSAGEQPGIRQTYLALHSRRVRGRATDTRIEDVVAAQIALRRVGTAPGDITAARQFALRLIQPANAVRTRAEGLYALATLDVVAADMAGAAESWRSAEQLDRSTTSVYQSLIALSPIGTTSADSMRALRATLTQSTAVGVTSVLSAAEHDAIRAYLIALISVRLGDDATALRQERVLETLHGRSRSADALRSAIVGHRALARGDTLAAVRALEAGMLDIPASIRAQSPVFEQHAERYALARALASLGQRDAARLWYTGLLDGGGVFSATYATAAREGLRRP